MKGLKVLFFVIGIICISEDVKGQDILLVEANASDTSIFLKWFPLDAGVWDIGLVTGYEIERVEVNQGQTRRTILEDKVLARDSVWFVEHAKELDGLMEPIGALLYDTTFQFQPNEELNPMEMKYNFILKEVENYNVIATAAGLGFNDMTADKGKKYRYIIRLKMNETVMAEGKLDFNFGTDFLVKNPKNTKIDYTFPDGKSLSDMQNKPKVTLPSLVGVARAYSDSIVLRWAPNTPRFWVESNDVGYSISRKDGIDGKIQEIAFVKPWTLDTLEGLIEHDSMALLAAATLYSTDGAELASGFYESSQMFENKWGFALYSAERSGLAGDVLGLRFVDSDVEPDKIYTYMIQSLAAPNFFASAYIPVKNVYTPLAPPVNFEIESMDKAVKLIWSKEGNESRFSAYQVERSDDGINWIPLKDKPIVFLETQEGPLTQFAIIDSLDANYKKQFYRVKGFTNFDETSPYAEEEGQGIDLTPPTVPLMKEAIFNDTTKTAIIGWDPGYIVEDFDGFFVLMGHKADEGPYDTISTKLAANQTTFTYKPEKGFTGEKAHYFKVVAQDINGNIAPSLEKYMHVPDLTAPPPPENFQGKIADDGTVELFWEHSSAEDLLGYYVYFSNNGEDEFSPLNPYPLTANYFTYKVQDVTLNENVYFLLLAEDERHNRGKTTDVLILKRPDKVPPLPPAFWNPKGYDGAVQLEWGKSPSEDVVKYYIYKRQYNSNGDWIIIKNDVDANSTHFADTAIVVDVFYEYKLQSVDDAGNISEETAPYRGKLPFIPEEYIVDNFKAAPLTKEKKALLEWEIDINPKSLPPNISWKYMIYKSSGARYFEPISNAPSETVQFIDPEPLKENVLYNYAVKILFSDGQEGELCPIKSVMLE